MVEVKSQSHSFEVLMKELRTLLSVFIAFIYLFLSIGVNLQAHFCHNNLSSISISFSESHCMCGGGDIEMSCCSTEETLIQLDQDCLVQSKKASTPDKLFVEHAIQIQTNQIQKDVQIALSEVDLVKYGPPIYLLNSSFIHYA